MSDGHRSNTSAFGRGENIYIHITFSEMVKLLLSRSELLCSLLSMYMVYIIEVK